MISLAQVSGTSVRVLASASSSHMWRAWRVEDELRNALAGLKSEEAAVLAMLRSRLANEFARTPAAAKSTGSIGEGLMPLSSNPVFTDR